LSFACVSREGRVRACHAVDQQIRGMVDRPVIMTPPEDIRRLPAVSRVYFLECAGNTQSQWRAPTLKTVQGIPF